MIYRIKRFIRDNESLMMLLSMIYRLFGFNHIKGRKGLKVQVTGVFSRKVKIINHGNNNVVVVGKGGRLNNCKIEIFGDGNKVQFDEDCVGNEVDIWISDGSSIEIGRNTHFTGEIHIACTEGKKIRIGERCLFSNEVVFRTGDSHSILNSEGVRINPAADILLGNHVWIGQQVVVLKGAIIGDESIIGTRSLVTGKQFENHAVLAGSPAQTVKRNVTWHHDLL